jgi:His-Xaa-Ser system protein HxsD
VAVQFVGFKLFSALILTGGKMPGFENIELHRQKNFALVSVNPKIFSLGVVFAAAYVLLEKAFIVIDGNPAEQIIVSLRPKKGNNLQGIACEFNEQLINFAVNFDQSERTKAIREEFIKQAFLTHSQK